MATHIADPAAAERFAVVDWDLEWPAGRVPGLGAVGPGVGAYVLLRMAGRPVGRLLVPPEQAVADLEGLALQALGSQVPDLLREHGMTRTDLFAPPPDAQTPDPQTPTESARRRRPLVTGPPVSVVVCTRDRPDGLRASLGSLLGQSHGDFEVVVVDNAPATEATRKVVAELADPRVRYVREDTPGLSAARNRALREIDRPLVAWLDDDETADPDWLAELATAFEAHPDVAAVSGFVFPAELDTQAQIHYESYGGHSKGRVMHPELFDPADRATADPLFPMPPFGVGANMAFRTAALRELGGFDEALGAGTPTQGGEDTLVFSQLLLAGHSCLFQPTAVTRHVHRRDLAGFSKQMYGYGTGLSAFYLALVLGDWRLVGRLPGLLWRGVRALRGTGEADSAVLGAIPAEALRRKWRGFLAGPVLYLRTRRAVRRRTAASRG